MKKIISVILLSIVVFSCTGKKDPVVNLVPTIPAESTNYWCTWYAQNYWVQRGNDLKDLNLLTGDATRDELTSSHLFNEEDGWVTNYLPHGRSDWYFLIDHGWQTKVDSERTVTGTLPLFSLQIDPRDFPEYADEEQQEALRLLNEKIKSFGWRGLGIWTRGTLDSATAHIMVEWSKYAGVEYWKIDGGGIKDFWSFKIKEMIFPELTLEYATFAGVPGVTKGNLNPYWLEADRTEYPSVYDVGGFRQNDMLRVLQNTDVLRTYDASPLLMTTTTLRRTNDILKQTQGQAVYRGFLNIQDDCNAAAGLGCLASAMRHPNYMERTLNGHDLHHQLSGKRRTQKRMNEAERFGRWSRIAPAFPVGEGTYLSSDTELVDSYRYTEYDTWYEDTHGKLVYQSAPAIMARNMPLPEVEIAGDPPYVLASIYPNGAICVATEGRVKPEDQWYHPRARVTIQVKDANQPIGVFGHYDTLRIEFREPIDWCKHVWAQDLLAENAVDIRSSVKMEGSTIIIPGKLIDEIGTSAGDLDDISVPGLVLKLVR